MTENTEINDIEQIQEEGTDTPIQEETLNSELVIEESEPIPNPWDNSPENVYFYEKMYPDGHLGSFTPSAELAYKSGWDIEHNYIAISDTQQSDINGWTYRKELCPMKTQEMLLTEARNNKLSELKKKSLDALENGYVDSSLGFKADANTTAVRDLEGLAIIGADTVMFCDFYNEFHALTKEQVQTLQREVLLNGQNLYAQKWTIRQQINEAESIEALNNIQIEFTMLDFSGD